MKYLWMFGKYIVFPLVIAAVGAALLIDHSKSLNGDGNWYDAERGLDQSEYLNLGGAKQYIRIRSRNRDNPILLNLHGGPGAPQTPYSHKLLRPLTEYFTVVEWDQRGSGRSTGDASLVETMKYDRMVDDTIELIEYLQKRFKRKKVILVGYSWGSMLGLGVIKKRPDLVHAYVGVGQALSWPGGFDETKRLLIEAAGKAGDKETVETLSKLPEKWPPAQDIDAFLERISVIQAPLVTYGHALHASKSNDLMTSDIVLEIVTSPDVSIREGLSILDLSDATKALMVDLFGKDLRVDFGNDYEVPVFIFQGKHDWQTPTTLVRPWFEGLVAPRKEYVGFEDSAHMLINEEPGKFLYELVNRVRPLALAQTGSDKAPLQ